VASLVIFSFSSLRPKWVFWDPQLSVTPSDAAPSTTGVNVGTTGANGGSTTAAKTNFAHTTVLSVMTLVLALLFQSW